MRPKDISELCIADLVESPRWMFYAGSDKEQFDSFVTVIPESHPHFDSDLICIAKTEYRFSDGSKHTGFWEPDMHHTIFVANRSISIWKGVREPKRDEIERLYHDVSLSADDIFPVIFATFDGSHTGSLDGFYYLDSDNHVRYTK